MNINFLEITGFPNKNVKVCAGMDEVTFVEFMMNIENIDQDEVEIFRKKVDDCVSCTLCLGNDQNLDYDFEKSKINFDLHDIKVSFVNREAPESLREVLCDFMIDEDADE